MHIVGEQNKNSNQEIEYSYFLRRHNHPVVPGSSIKGMLRAFIEALTNSWVGQATDEYKRKAKEIAHAFNAISIPPLASGIAGPVIPERFHPKNLDGKIDLTSFLFGTVLEGSNEANAFPSRFIFEDIIGENNCLDKEKIKLPDVPEDAFMGGPKPRINNWWYFTPDRIKSKTFQSYVNTDFMGKEYWGRKFYYHQKPENVLAWYADGSKWPHKKIKDKTNIYRDYPIEVVKKNSILNGKMYFENIPHTFLGLVILSLCPQNMAHKLGYGQAFGLGSIQIVVKNIHTHKNRGFGIARGEIRLDPKTLDHSWYRSYVDEQALQWLSRILHYDEKYINIKENIFTYPLFNPVQQGTKAEFTKLVQWTDARDAAIVAGALNHADSINLTPDQAQNVAKQLWDKKKTIHFRLYQEKSRLWTDIEKRA